MNLITTPMATSAVFKRLEGERVEGADEPAGIDGKVKRGKQKAKAKAGAGRKSRKIMEAEEVEQDNRKLSWSPMAHPIQLDDRGIDLDFSLSRPKHALDDFMSCFFEVVATHWTKRRNDKVQTLLDNSILSVFRHAISCFLEMCWTGSVALNGKFARNYTSFRSELITFVETAVQMAVSAAQTGADKDDAESSAGYALFGKLLGDFSSADAAGASQVQIGHLMDESHEAQALERIKLGTPKAKHNGMAEFIQTSLILPLDFHSRFSKAGPQDPVAVLLLCFSLVRQVLGPIGPGLGVDDCNAILRFIWCFSFSHFSFDAFIGSLVHARGTRFFLSVP